MNESIRNIGIVLAAGIGARFHKDLPKQFHDLKGREVISYVLDAFSKSERTEALIVVLSPEEYEKEEIARKYNVETVCGGVTRPQSQLNALNYIHKHYPSCERIIYHDAARPLIDAAVFDQYFEWLKTYDYVCTCQKITDSLGSCKKEIPKREDYFLLQTPEGYRFKLLYDNIDEKTCEQKNFYASYFLPEGSRGYFNYDVKNNFKITYPEDLRFVELWMNTQSDDNYRYVHDIQ